MSVLMQQYDTCLYLFVCSEDDLDHVNCANLIRTYDNNTIVVRIVLMKT